MMHLARVPPCGSRDPPVPRRPRPPFGRPGRRDDTSGASEGHVTHTKAGRATKSLSHNVINAGSFSRPIVHPEYAPRGAERWRGGDGRERIRAEAHADDLADPGRAVVHRTHGAATRRVASVAGAAVDRITARARRRAVRAAHRLPMEGGAGGVWLRVDRTPTIPAVGGARLLGGDVAPAAPVL